MSIDALASCVVKDEKGADVHVGDLWKDRTVVIAWVRHFG
jgi:hypothetical protein